MFVLLFVFGGCYAMPAEPEQVLQKVELSYIKDGDTIVVKDALKDSDVLYLKYDEERKDQYDRVLAYVFASNNGDITGMVNGWMVKDGYATVLTIEPNTKYAEQFEFYQKTAKDAGRGHWEYEELQQ